MRLFDSVAQVCQATQRVTNGPALCSCKQGTRIDQASALACLHVLGSSDFHSSIFRQLGLTGHNTVICTRVGLTHGTGSVSM